MTAPGAAAPLDLEDRATRLVTLLLGRGQTLATAESLTGGLIAATMTAVPGASRVFRGGIVVYATDLKTALADVDAALLATGGAVQEAVADQLAAGARHRCNADWGIGITGVAGPDPQDGQAVGVVFCAVAGPGVLRRSAARHLADSGPAVARRDAIRHAAVAQALDLLRTALGGEQAGPPSR